MSAKYPLACFFSLLSLFILPYNSLFASEARFEGQKKDKLTLALIQPLDGVGTPFEQITVVAEVEKKSVIPVRKNLIGKMVGLFENGALLAKERTDIHGQAVFHLAPRNVGEYKFTFKNLDPSLVADESTVQYFVWDKETPIVISDIDQTLCYSEIPLFLVVPPQLIPTLPKAAATLNRIAEEWKYKVVYLTARENTFALSTKVWLKYHQFVAGPALFYDFGLLAGDPNDTGEYKYQKIKKLKEKFPNILIGFGDKPHDVMAYRRNDMRAYYIGNPKEAIYRHSIRVKSWDEIWQNLIDLPLGHAPGDPFTREWPMRTIYR